MRLVVQNDKSHRNGAAVRRHRRGRPRRPGRAGHAGFRGGVAALAAAAIASACAPAGAPGGPGGTGTARPTTAPTISRQPLKAPPPATTGTPSTQTRPTHTPPTQKYRSGKSALAARAAAARRWGLARIPLTPPPPPLIKPKVTTREGFEVDGHEELGLPPVFTTVPTKQRVVFLTIDDGAEKDPAFLRMMNDLQVPYTAFLSDYLIKDDYGYFKRMQRDGVALNNHTLHHPYLPALSYRRQQYEICAMQDVIEERYGKRPLLFRPPFGNYDRDSLRAAKSCGVRYVPLWNEEVFVDHWEYREWDQRIRPGDIVLTHFRGRDDWKGTMPDMIRRFLNKVTAEGYAVARLEDYL
ncbi:polysaccharide deacetylase family protein [Streptomyces sp. NPDC057740]|uniref:polysaccharide deacetylase family protein n=1 Tax=Streptomyces sp. NPDC057740 TaxID=3346234 RepID=UPI0036CC6A23